MPLFRITQTNLSSLVVRIPSMIVVKIKLQKEKKSEYAPKWARSGSIFKAKIKDE